MSERSRPRRGRRDAGPRGPREVLYDTQIAPLLDQIFALCDEHDIDFVMAFALDDHGDRTRIAGSSRTVRDDVGVLKVAQSIVSGRATIMPVDMPVDVDLEKDMAEAMDGTWLDNLRPPGRA